MVQLPVSTRGHTLVSLFIVIVCLESALGQDVGFKNPDFEEGEPGKTPSGWVVPKMLADQGFAAVLTAQEPQSGKLCAEIRWPTGATPKAPFANLMQSIDAVPWRGKQVKITAAIRVASGEDDKRAQMWLRVDRAGGMGAFDNMNDRPVRGQTWADYSITADIADDAQKINLGLMTRGGATAWWDNIRMEVVGEFTTLRDPPRPLDDSGLRNLVALARLVGYVRYFHPSDTAATTDWLRFIVQVLPKVEEARDSTALAAELQAAFQSIAPTVRVFQTGQEPVLPAELQPPASSDKLKVRFWEHLGCGPAAGTVPGNIYSSQRVTLDVRDPASLPQYAQPANVFRCDLGMDIGCWVPTALYADAGGTLPHHLPGIPAADAKQARFSIAHRCARLATVMLAWNVFQHFYPYFDVVGTDWSKELEIALRAAATDADDAAFYRTLNRLVVQLHDGHASLNGPGMPVVTPLHARVELIEGKIVVTGVPPETPDLKPGDVVERIDGRPALEVFDETAGETSAATAQWRNWKVAQRFGPRPPASTATLEVRGADGEIRTIKVACGGSKADDAIRRPPKLHEIEPGIWYVDVTRLTDTEFDAALPDLAKARGLIFEMRGYPHGQPQWLGHLSPHRLESAFWNVPRLHRPDRTDVEWVTRERWNLEVKQPQLTTNRVFLADGSTISYAESVMGIVEAYKLGEIVGEPTAGTNGNINKTELPLGYSVWWTGMKVLKHDGSQHHGVGIQPTIPVSRTIEGIRAGRDEQLERALTLLK
jgi:C-terminal processing protease CtpA/Prc